MTSFQALAGNPLDFLNKNAVDFPTSNLPQEYRSKDGASFISGEASLKLVKTQTGNLYNIQFVVMKDFDSQKDIKAFVLGYKRRQGNDDVPTVDIPQSVPEGKFLFTAGLTGCSMIVTHSHGDKFHVFHDRRMDSAVLYDNVVMKVDYNDYRVGGRYHYSHTGSAMTCMHFKSGAWKMFVQRQLPLVPGQVNWEVYAVEHKGSFTPESLHTVFNDRRTILQNRVKANARNLKVDNKLIDAAKDGVVQGVVFSKDAVSKWEALRKATTDQIEKDTQKGIKPSLKDTYDRFKEDVSVSEDMDETWIWLQVKKNKAKVKH